MSFAIKTLFLPKDFDTPQYCEDAFAVDESTRRIAVADGVSTGIFSAEWAQILTRSAIGDPPEIDEPKSLIEWLDRARLSWRNVVSGVKLQWHQRPKMVDGAMATLLYVELSESEAESTAVSTLNLKAFAIGDTCLFHQRNVETLSAFPLANSTEFGLAPQALRSIDRFQQDGQLQFARCESTLVPGDLIVLCTDAVALWAYRLMEEGTPVDWSRFWDVTLDDWRAEVQTLREQCKMRVDDCTLILMRVGDEAQSGAAGAIDATTESASME